MDYLTSILHFIGIIPAPALILAVFALLFFVVGLFRRSTTLRQHLAATAELLSAAIYIGMAFLGLFALIAAVLALWLIFLH